MYELMVLGVLARRAMHGYGIAKIIENIMGPFRRVQWGALYPVLKRLETEGAIAAEDGHDDDGNARKVFCLTDLGRERLHDLVMDTEHHLGEYDMTFAHKVTLFFLLTPEEQLYLSRHYVVYAQQNVDHLNRKRRDVNGVKQSHMSDEQIGLIHAVMEHRAAYWQGEQAWAEALIAQNRIPSQETI